jgi:hypothetical protein
MDEPVLSVWGERLRERTQPLQPDDEGYDWTHAVLCESLARPYLQVAELIDPPEPYPPWGPLFDLNACPSWALPWLAQAVGVILPVGISDDAARALILEAAGHRAGTVAAITAVLRTTLVSSNPPNPATVWFRERYGSAYILEIVTLDAETPDPAYTQRVLEAAIPGGLKLIFNHVEGWDYQVMTDEGGTYAQQSLDYATYSDLTQHIKGGVVPPPVLAVTNCVPAAGPVTGGTPVTITGTMLTGVLAVYFGNKWTTAVTIVDDTTITCNTPPQDFPGVVGVRVEDSTGQSPDWQSFTFS